MQLSKFLYFTLTVSVIAQLQTNIDIVINDIFQLDTAVRKLTTATATYAGGILLTQGIDFLSVESRLTRANVDVSRLPPQDLSVPDIKRLEDVVSQTLAIDNPKAVDTLISKRDLIRQTPLQSGVVKKGLQSLLAGHLYFSRQALERTPDSELQNVQRLVDVISDALHRGIDAFPLT